MYTGHGFLGFGFIWAGLSAAFFIMALAAAIVVIVLLIRFLVVGTRAAQLYLDRHEPRTPSQPVGGPAPAAPAPAAAASPVEAPASAPAPATAAPAVPASAPAQDPTPLDVRPEERDATITDAPEAPAPRSALNHAAGGASGTTGLAEPSAPKPTRSRSVAAKPRTARTPKPPTE